MENGLCKLLKHTVKPLIGKHLRILINELKVVFGQIPIKVLKQNNKKVFGKHRTDTKNQIHVKKEL